MGVVFQIVGVLAGGWVLARVAVWLRLPALLGMIIAGTLVGTLDLPAALPGPRLEQWSSPLRVAIPTVLLLRAGLGISLPELRRLGSLGLRLGIIPVCVPLFPESILPRAGPFP